MKPVIGYVFWPLAVKRLGRRQEDRDDPRVALVEVRVVRPFLVAVRRDADVAVGRVLVPVVAALDEPGPAVRTARALIRVLVAEEAALEPCSIWFIDPGRPRLDAAERRPAPVVPGRSRVRRREDTVLLRAERAPVERVLRVPGAAALDDAVDRGSGPALMFGSQSIEPIWLEPTPSLKRIGSSFARAGDAALEAHLHEEAAGSADLRARRVRVLPARGVAGGRRVLRRGGATAPSPRRRCPLGSPAGRATA